MDHGVHYGRRHGDDALEQKSTDDDIRDGRLVDRCAADKDGGDGGQRHVERRGVDLDEAEALLIDEDADGGKPCAHNNREHTHLVDIDACGLSEGRVRADGGHCGAGLGVEESPHQESQQREEQQSAGRDGEVADVDLQEVCKHLVIEALEGNRGPQALAGKAPDHCRAFIRQQQPHHAHERDGREADVSRDHHLAALDLIEQPAVACAEDQGKGSGDNDCHDKAHGSGEAELYRERRAEKTGDNAEGQAEVEATAGVDHRYHRKHEDRVPAEAVNGVGDLGRKVRADKGSGNKQEQEEACDDESRQAEGVDSSFEPVHECGVLAG